MVKKTLELVFKDTGGKTLNMSFKDPKESIEKTELTELETTIRDSKVFVGPEGDIVGFGKAYTKEVIEKDLLQG